MVCLRDWKRWMNGPLRVTAFVFGCAAPLLVARAQGPSSVWSGVYAAEQASKGQTLYSDHCSSCPGDDLQGDAFAPALIAETFTGRWQNETVGDLFGVVKQTMPQDRPASLADDEYASIIAYLLKANRYPAGAQLLGSVPTVLGEIKFAKP